MPRQSGRKTGRGPRAARQINKGLEGHSAKSGARAEGPRALQFTRLNWVLLASAAVVLVGGYLALASGSPIASTVIAPVLLVAAYAVLIPLGLIL